MDKRGFTLIELLAVILILGIIALIAIPTMTAKIEESKKQASINSAKNVMTAIENTVLVNSNNDTLNDIEDGIIYDISTLKSADYSLNVSNNDLEGKIYLKDGMVENYMIQADQYCIEKRDDKTISTKKKCKFINLYVNNKKIDTNSKAPVCLYFGNCKNGTELYFNPQIAEFCSISDYSIENSATENVSGCMKWYVFNDGELSSSIILDHNTSSTLPWQNDVNYHNLLGPGSLFEALVEDVNDWSNDLLVNWKTSTNPYVGKASNYGYDSLYIVNGAVYIKPLSSSNKPEYTIFGAKARVISAEEIASIVNYESMVGEKWNSSFTESGYLFDSGSSTEYSPTCTTDGDISGCKYGWLYDRTYPNCVTSGCYNNAEQQYYNMYGYWTISASATANNLAWRVTRRSKISSGEIDYINRAGIRPVLDFTKR